MPFARGARAARAPPSHCAFADHGGLGLQHCVGLGLAFFLGVALQEVFDHSPPSIHANHEFLLVLVVVNNLRVDGLGAISVLAVAVARHVHLVGTSIDGRCEHLVELVALDWHIPVPIIALLRLFEQLSLPSLLLLLLLFLSIN